MRIEELIASWKKSLYRHKSLEEGIITELEDHLRDEIKKLIDEGHDAEEAFQTAVEKIGPIADINRDEKIARISHRAGTNILGLALSFVKAGSRAFAKNRMTSMINVIGLGCAFTAILFIGLFVYDELSFEKRHPDADRIYRLSYSYQQENGEIEDRAYASGMWIDQLAPRMPAIEDRLRFLNISYGYVHNPETQQSFYEEGIYWSDPNFFEFLNFPVKYGNKERLISDFNSIVLTESTALKVFGEENPVGKELMFRRRSQEVNLRVTGVIFDPPSNSQFKPKYVAHLQAVQNIYGESYRGWIDKNPRPGYVYTYFKVQNHDDIPLISAEMENIWSEAIPDRADRIKPLLTPLTSIHFNPPVKWESDTPIDISYIYGLCFIGIFILIIALTNFVNLTTAQGGQRQKEIGIRKTLGSTKTQLRFQFFLEAISMILIALVLAVSITFILIKDFNMMVDKNINIITTYLATDFLIWAVPVILSIMIFSGLFPAFYFTRQARSSFNMTALFRKERSDSPARNALVVLQYTIAITLIVSTITVFNQLNMINNGGLAKSQETVIGIRTSRMGDSIQAQRYKTLIQSIPGVESNTLGMHLPRQSDFGRINTRYFVRQITEEPFYWNKFDADGGFVKTFDLKLLAGVDFRKNIERGSLIVNRAVIEELGVTPEEAIGLALDEDSINYVYGRSHGRIVGVVENFAYKSVKEKIEPLVICANTPVEGVLSVKLSEGEKQPVISRMEEQWHEVYPGRPFEYWFLNKEFDRLYNQERRLGKLIPIFSSLAVIIALLGLFALTVYIAELRRKEIGIRKALGCSANGILKLLGWQFLKTLIPAVIISIPISYIGMNYWLDNFTYRIEVSFWVMAVSITAILVLSLMTIGFKSYMAAISNPVNSLKYE